MGIDVERVGTDAPAVRERCAREVFVPCARGNRARFFVHERSLAHVFLYTRGLKMQRRERLCVSAAF